MPVGRFENAWANVRHAYEVSRSTVRAARSKAEEPNGPGPDLPAPGADEAAAPPQPVTVDEAVPRSLRIAAAWSWRLIVVAVVAWGLLYLIDRYLILVAPLMIGLLLAGLLAPALRWVLPLVRNRSLAALLVLVAGLGVVVGTITLAVNQLLADLDKLVASAEQGIADIQDWVQGPPLNLTEADLENLVEQGTAWVNENTETLTTVGLSAVTGTVQFITGMVLALVATFFYLRDGRRIWTFLMGTLPVRARAPMTYAGDGAWRSLTGYVRATVLVAFIDAVGIGLGLWLLRVPLFLPLAALVFLGAFVPIIGAFLSGTVAVLVALVDADLPGVLNGGGPIKALLVLGLIILVQQIEGNILQPVIMSRAVQIHPLAVIIAVTAGILVAQIIGALVAVPAVAVLNSVVRRLNQYHRPPVSTHPAPATPPGRPPPPPPRPPALQADS
ncbi:MAG: AI-2E family transporter [Micromonosporaceae bacterium]|nr:AI-2E family transporter [Micromonosporaceae bacterium]